MRVKEESEKAGLKLNIQRTKIMASSPFTAWQREEETVEMVTNYFWAPKSLQTVTQPWTRTLTPWKESYDQPT